MESYKDAPISLAEKRSTDAADASLWKPRDALISMLREIDGGRDIAALIIAFRDADGDKKKGIFYVAAGTVDKIESLGMLSRVSHIIQDQE